jgi:putative membrane protein
MDGAMFGGFGIMALVVFLLNVAFVVVVVAVAVLGIRWLVRSLDGKPGGAAAAAPMPEDSALSLLRERFARGEIDADEYEQRRRTLGG